MAKKETALFGSVAQLLGKGEPERVLAPVERRLVEIAGMLWQNTLISVLTLEAVTAGGPSELTIDMLNDELMQKVSRLTLVAAVEMEGQLRELRSGLEKVERESGNG